MKLKLMSLFAGLVTVTLLATPIAAQACNGANKDRTTQDSSNQIPTESSFISEDNATVS